VPFTGGRAAARRALGVSDDERACGVAFGGSLGARRINDAIVGVAEAWQARDDVAIRHVIGERDWERYSDRVHALGEQLDQRRADGLPALQYDAVRYEHEMPAIYASADLILCRAGASTVAELAVTGVASVLVPLPGAPGDHQTANARALVVAGGARLLADADATESRVQGLLDELVGAPDERQRMAGAARALARPDAAERVAELLERYARREDSRK
jgi:UDP-N-acetylglucosamine:LPS N-acetylglucosamine transferase